MVKWDDRGVADRGQAYRRALRLPRAGRRPRARAAAATYTQHGYMAARPRLRAAQSPLICLVILTRGHQPSFTGIRCVISNDYSIRRHTNVNLV